MRNVFALLVVTFSTAGHGAKAAALVDMCSDKLVTQVASPHSDMREGHWRLFFGQQEVDIYNGASVNGHLDRSYLVIGKNKKTESLKSALKNIDALERIALDRYEFSPNKKRITLYGEGSAGVVTINLRSPYTSADELDIRDFHMKLENRKDFALPFAERSLAPVAVVESEARIRIYEGAAAEEILELLIKNGALQAGPQAYYRGLHFFRDKGLYAPIYLATHVEVQYLLRGLRALKLRRDHPIFRSLID